MIYVISGRLAFTNNSRRNNAVTQIQAYATAHAADLFVPAQIGPYDGSYKYGPAWQFALNFELRFLTAATRDDLWTQADAALGSGAQGPIAGAMLHEFDSNADDESNPDQSQINPVTRNY